MLPDYLKNHAYSLNAVTNYDDFSDLMPLRDILKNVNIVGLGESTHGTREFFQLKHRLTRFLVENMGFRFFTLEAGILPCMNINDYVLKGKGDRAKALASQGYWTWDTEEVTDMIEWMRQYNLTCTRGNECQFIGYDIKPIAEACIALRRILAVVDVIAYARAGVILDRIEAIPFPCDNNENINHDDILWLMGWMTANEQKMKRMLSKADYDLAVICARMVYQYLDSMVVNRTSCSARDYHMAENIKFMLDGLPKNSKIVVWAHNEHIAVTKSWKNMGWWLRENYGDRYYPFALTFTRGQFQSRLKSPGEPLGALEIFDTGEPGDGFWEKDLCQLKGDYYFNLRDLIKKDESTRKWAENNYQSFNAGGCYSPLPESDQTGNFFEKYMLGERFDGVFHIEHTTSAIPTPTGRREKSQPPK